MKIKESKNLKYEKLPKGEFFEGYDVFDPRICVLERFNRVDDRLDLRFKNGSLAIIRAVNIEGGKEMDLIEEKIGDFIGKSYEEILNADF